MRAFFRNIILLIGCLLTLPFANAQMVLEGRVVDGHTGEVLPYVNIVVVGQPKGTITDFEGTFTLELDRHYDSLKAAYVGYKSQTLPIPTESNAFIEFNLNPDAEIMDEIVVRPGVNPAIRVIKAASKKKKDYNVENIPSYEYESFTRIQLAIDNVTEKFKKRKVYDAVQPLFDTVSALTEESGNKVLPVFVSETLSDYYYRNMPKRSKEVIKASKIRGVGVGDDSYVNQLLGSTFQSYNFNQNNLYILDKNFISPISLQATSYYIYQLVDSLPIDGTKTYKIQVWPKNEHDLVFKGTIWITNETFALKRVSLEINQKANLNFIEKLKIQQEMEEVSPGVYLPVKTRVLIDVSEVTDNTVGLIGLYYNSAKNCKVNVAHELKFYEEKVKVLEGASTKTDEFWETARHDKLTAGDERIYQMVDTLKNQPVIKTYVDVVQVLVEGYKPLGPIEVGPYVYLIGYNPLEGFRSRIGARTTEDFSKKWSFGAYGAYGFRDKRFKYHGRAEYIASRTKWTKFGVSYTNDIEQIGLTDEDYGNSSLFNSFSTIGSNQLNRAETYRIYGESEIVKGYIQRFQIRKKSYFFEPIQDFNFAYRTQPEMLSSSPLASDFTTFEVRLQGRLSHKELSVIRKNNRVSLGHLKAPVVTWTYTKGWKNVMGGDFNYDKLELKVWQYNSLANLGTFEYTFWIGKTFGQLPYPLLNIMRGNESFLSNAEAFNMMNFFEFVSDQYVALRYEHQFNGIIMNRAPLLKKWNLRSFANFKGCYGSLSQQNKDLIPSLDGGGKTISQINTFNQNGVPYMEVGYGIENIFRFVRIDFIHRLTYLSNANASPFGVKGTAVFRF